MTEVISHRGPDDRGELIEDGIALGMRRLSVIDLSGGAQPIGNEDGSVVTVFNGEIYNYRDLRADLERRGHRFATASDTETIVHAYEEHGVDFPRRLSGMFAIALWDRRRRRLLLARDRMGIKPLYVAQGPHGLAFASEVKSLLAGGLLSPELDPLAAELFLAYGYVPGPRTLFRGIAKLAPGTVLVREEGTDRTLSYWDAAAAAPEDAGRSWDSDEERLLELLRASVRAELVSDVPLGVMLSGGIDSSLITALAAEARPRVDTFSIGFAEDAESNELADARRVAERFGTEHHELLTSASEHPGLLDDALWHLEEPIADLSHLGFQLLCGLARQHVTVALAGQGADELLGGYRKHQIAAAADAAGRLRAAAALRAAARLAPAGSTLARGLAAVGAEGPEDRLLAMSRVVGPEERDRLLCPGFRVPGAEAEIRAAVRARVDERRQSALAQTLQLDARLALPDLMLMYFDRASMAHSLEVRVPFLSPELVAFCQALPDSRRIYRGRRKELLRRVAGRLLDPETVGKKKRAFFRNAVGSWIDVHRAEVRETLSDRRARERGHMRPDAVAAMSGGGGAGALKTSQQLLAVYLLERWQRLFTDPDSRGRRLTR